MGLIRTTPQRRANELSRWLRNQVATSIDTNNILRPKNGRPAFHEFQKVRPDDHSDRQGELEPLSQPKRTTIAEDTSAEPRAYQVQKEKAPYWRVPLIL